jgi:uncharacterized membrane protein YagU involved in acid resistance
MSLVSQWIKTGAAVAVSDGLFASATGMWIKPYATPFRVFRGVASVLFGKGALEGGTQMALVGMVMHLCVALFWSGVFLIVLENSDKLRAAIQSGPGAIAIALVYGISIWLIMSLIVIPTMVHRPPSVTTKWLVQLIGHPLFVVTPMILLYRNFRRGPAAAAV